MKKFAIALIISGCALGASAQSAIDAYNIIPSQTRGTARFMAMGGAFTSLGGDLSSITQNPAGIGVYRKSEIGATLDVEPRRFSTSVASGEGYSTDLTRVSCNNFGYVGACRLSGPVKFIQWGATFNRLNSFTRDYQAYNYPTNTSLSNYIASYTAGTSSSYLTPTTGYDPYYDSDCDWLSILAYNSKMIAPTTDGQYRGLYQNGQTDAQGNQVIKPTEGDALYMVKERGYADEYNLSFGLNALDVVYVGLGVGIYDISYERSEEYSESMANARLASPNADGKIGNAGFNLSNWQRISASGANIKLGVIVKPIDELRIGVAVHTPTWLTCTTSSDAQLDYSYYNPDAPESSSNPYAGTEYSGVANYNWRLNTPWRLMAGISTVINSKAIISADYERRQYPAMTSSYQSNNYFGNYYETNSILNDEIKQYFRGSNILRVGAEYRVTPQFSVRAGYNFTSSNVKSEASTGRIEVLTAGTLPSYRFDNTMHNISAGLGYRYKFWSIDAAYVYSRQNSDFHAYTDYNGLKAPECSLTSTCHHIVLSTSFKF